MLAPKELSIDIETYSSVDLIRAGVYAYAYAPDFSVLLFAYAFDEEEIQIVDLAQGEQLPDCVFDALTDASIVKTAFNANFERVCLQKQLEMRLAVEQWRCSAVAARELSLPPTLQKAAAVLNLEQQKDSRGKALIRYFCKPVAPTKTNGGRSRNLPCHSPEKWELFKSYCKQDVATERDLKRALSKFPVCQKEWRLWFLDQHISDRGVNIDTKLMQNAIRFQQKHAEVCEQRAAALSGITNVNSVAQIKAWYAEEMGLPLSSLNKEMAECLAQESQSIKVREFMALRLEMAKASVSKYKALERSLCPDGRVRGLLLFYGASRTGRWAGRIVQVQNLPQNHIEDLELARKVVKEGDDDLLAMLYGNVPQVLSELVRTAFIPSGGRRFIVADFSAIEARIIAWLAEEKWRIAAFAKEEDIYCVSASRMFHVPVIKHGTNGELRQKGKVAELALGYGGSCGALISMGALKKGLTEEELPGLVSSWRRASPAITSLWKSVETAAIQAVKGTPSRGPKGITFFRNEGILWIGLPSGRKLAYYKPEIRPNKFGRPGLTYMGTNQTKGTWERQETFGGKLVENITQAIARDCLAESFVKLCNLAYDIVFHVHDEFVLDVPYGKGCVADVESVMGEPIQWAPGLLLKAEGYECAFYKKE